MWFLMETMWPYVGLGVWIFLIYLAVNLPSMIKDVMAQKVKIAEANARIAEARLELARVERTPAHNVDLDKRT